MAVEIRPVNPTRSELNRFVRFGIDFYRGNRWFVPPLVMDDVNTLDPKTNPAYEFCESRSFMAYRDNKPVGRITGIINRKVNERTGVNTVRFGFVEFIDDREVSEALFRAVEEWGREKGMTEIAGPLGFTDLDHEGMLTYGFEELGTMATIYNPAYYPEHLKARGMEVDAEWVEYRIDIPSGVPEKVSRISEIIRKRYGLKVASLSSKKELKEKYGVQLFKVINEAYDSLYAYSPLTDRQIEHYIGQYLGILKLNDVCVIVDKEDNLTGVGISMPSFSIALQKSRGRFLPFGWYHLLRAWTGHTDTVDLLLVAVKPEYQNKGVNALIMAELIPNYIRNGYKYAESNPELHTNAGVQNQWQYFEKRQHRRRAAFKKKI